MAILSISPIAKSTAQLLQEADSLRYSDYRRILELTAQALDAAQKSGDYEAFTTALAHQAWANAMLNCPGEALTGAMEALVLARNHGYGEVEAHALYTIGYIFATCGLRQEAHVLFDYQQRLAETLRNSELQALSLTRQGLTYIGSGDIQTAIEKLSHALAIVPAYTHDGLDRAYTLSALMLAFAYSGRFNEALALAAELLTIVNYSQNSSMIANAETSVSYVHILQGDLVQSETHLRRASAYVDALAADDENKVLVEIGRGNLFSAQGLMQQGIDAMERAYHLSLQIDRTDLARVALNFTKSIYERDNDLPGVVDVYRRLNEDIVAQQQKHGGLRLKVLAMVFSQNKAAIQEEIHLTQQKYALLQRLSHEFRTPLAIIKSTADLVNHQGEEMPLPQRQNHLRSITGQVKGMTAMLESITRLLGDDDTEPERQPMREFSVGTVSFLALRRLERDELPVERVVTDIHPDVQAMIVPAEPFETAVYHLLNNALKFSADEVSLTIWSEEGELRLSVSDRGIGIPEADQPLIFQPLTRASNIDQASGAGLGLAIVAKMVAKMGGEVGLSSAEGQGTTVTVRLPLPRHILTTPAWRMEDKQATAKKRTRKTKKTT